MDIFNPLEKLLVEHGSSIVQGKHIAFLRDQLSTIKEHFSKLETENKILKSDIAKLTEENNGLKKERNQIQDKTSEITARIAKEQEEILKFVSTHKNASEDTIIRQTKMSQQLTGYHLGKLYELKFLNNSVSIRDSSTGYQPPTTWYITQKGQEYLYIHGLLT